MNRAASIGCACWALAGLASLAEAASPTISMVSPVGGQRGTEVEVTVSGARLGDARGALWYRDGIAVKAVEPPRTAKGKAPQSSQVKLRLAIAADARLGAHPFRIVTASGVSNLLTFSVGALPETVETEPNDELGRAQPIALGTTASGVIQAEDVDYYVVEVKKGTRIAAEIEAIRLGFEFFDPALTILDGNRFVLASADDSTTVWQDSVCAAVAPADGRYFIEVRDSSFGGSGRSRYRLHVGGFPRPLAALPAGGRPGQRLTISWLGDGPAWTEVVQLPARAETDFGFSAATPKGISPWPLPLRLCPLDNQLEREPNNEPAAATPFAPPLALDGVLDRPGDVDCYRFAGKKGQVLDLKVFARGLRSPVDSVLTVRRAKGGTVGNNDDAGGPDSQLRVTLPADDDYLVELRDHLHQGGPAYAYRVEVAAITPALTLSLPEREEFDDIVAAVPRGNRLAVMVGVQRDDFSGEVKLDLRGLPAGITAEALPIAEADTRAPLLLSAAADAPLAAALVDIAGRAEVNGQSVEGSLRQRTSMVRGQNKREVWNQYTDRMATAVTEAVPFHLELVQPKTPIVQNGSMHLKVRAVRQKGFDEPITLAFLHLPPGLSSTTSVTMPKGRSEALMPLTADANARIGAARLIVLGEAAVGDGKPTVASGPIELQVSEPYVRFAFPSLTVEQGKSAEWVAEIRQQKGFEGEATAELVGLPGEVASRPRAFKSDAGELVFPLTTTAKSPAGKHKSILGQVVVTVAGEPVAHTVGPAELRIVRPAPPKPLAVPKPAAKPPVAASAPASKRLSRLEQLRLARQQNEK